MTIERAQFIDCDAVDDTIRRLSKESPHTGSPLGQVEVEGLRTRIRDLLANPNVGVFVAWDHERIVGLVGTYIAPHLISSVPEALEICWWVEPSQRNGLGWKLLAAAETWAHQNGAGTITMMAPTEQYARALRRRGYRIANYTMQRRF